MHRNSKIDRPVNSLPAGSSFFDRLSLWDAKNGILVVHRGSLANDRTAYPSDASPMNSSVILARTSMARAPTLPYTAPTWDDWVAAMLDPINQTGSTDSLSRNFHWSLGLVGLPGRAGLGAGLSLNYNSLVWTKFDTSMAFDLDSGFPSPGFRLGFPVIYGPHTNADAGVSAYLMITPDGGRVELRQIGITNVYESADSAYLQMIDNGDGTLLVRTTDGTRLSYTGTGNGYRCTQIKDANGNYITITNHSSGRLQTMTDTLGRVFTVNYDSNNNPTSIGQTRGGSQYTWVTFGYEEIEFIPDFRDREIDTELKSWTLPVLTQVGLPDGTYYKFEYNSFAQVSKVSYFAADSESDDHLLNYIANDLDDAISGSPGDVPRIGSISVLAENWQPDTYGDPQEVTTTFSEPEAADCSGSGTATDCQLSVVTAPDGTQQKTFTRVAGDWDYGLPVREETWGLDESSSFVKQRWVTTNWTQESTSVGYLINPRVTETSVFDSSNQKRTAISYQNLAVACGSGCSTDIHLPESVAEYAANATTVLRTTETDYLESTNYLDRRIIGLPVETRVYDGTNSGTLMAKTGLYYDESGDYLVSQGSSIPQFDATNYGTSFTYRGNLTKSRRYEMGTSNYTENKIGYNTTGSVILTTDALNHGNTIAYSSTYGYAYPTTVTDAGSNSATVAYNAYTGQKTHTQTPDLSTTVTGAGTTFSYDTIGRIYQVTNDFNSANTLYYYPTNGTNVTTYSTIKDLSTYTVAATNTDGLGRTIATATEHPGSGGGYKAQTTVYDLMGRVVSASNPTEINGSFVPDGDDVAGWLFTTQTYDWKGRPRITTNQDSTTREVSYGGCGCAGGDVVTIQDEGTMISSTLTRRKQKITNDVLGRTVKAETYNWDGSTVYSTVTNAYNVLDQVTLTKQYAGSTSSSDHQETTAEYDGYGRLYRQHVPEQFTVSGSTETPTYTTFSYNADDTRATVTDGRGATATYSYDNRHLVTQIEYAVPGGSSIYVPDDTVFTYDGAGNRTTMSDDTGNTEYVYDQQSHLTDETRYFDLTLPSAPESGNGFHLEYTYGLDGKLATLTDPYSHTFTYARDNLGRLTGVTGTSFAGVTTYASNAVYRAWDTPKALNYGNSLSMAVTFNSRQQPETFEIGKTGSTIIQKAYDYYNDGRIKFADDLLNAKFDRSTKYDSVGHVEEGLTGARARGETLDDYANQPYQESFGYDAFGHIISRDTRHWVAEYSTSDSYDRNRRTGWDYDANGRILRLGSTTDNDEVSYEYDAAGRETKIEATAKNRTEPIYDGEGRILALPKFIWQTTTSSYPSTAGQFILLIRSTVLGGKVVSEAVGPGTGVTTAAGSMYRSRVYADGTELATLNVGFGGASDAVLWPMIDPAQGSYRVTNSSGAVPNDAEARAEMDPVAANVQPENPYDSANPSLYPPVGSSSLFGFSVTPVDQRILMNIDNFVMPNSVSVDGIPMSLADIKTNWGYALIGNEFDLVQFQAFRSYIVRYDDFHAIGQKRSALRNDSDGLFGYRPLGSDGLGGMSVWHFWQGEREPGPTPRLSGGQVRVEEVDVLDVLKRNHSFGDAGQVIQTSDSCRAFFSQGRSLREAREVLQNLWHRVTTDRKMDYARATTENSGQGSKAQITLSGLFYSNTSHDMGYIYNPDAGRYEHENYGLTPRQFRAFTVLHELAHALGLIPTDKRSADPYRTQSVKNDDTINDNCGLALGQLPGDD